MSDQPIDFSVKFGKIARTLEYNDPEGHLTFTFDQGAGDKSLCLEHLPARKQTAPCYRVAFERTKEFLQSKGYQVEIYGDFAGATPIEAPEIKILIEQELANLSRPLKSHFDLGKCLVSPKRAVFTAQPGNDTWNLWVVLEERPLANDGYKIVFDEFSKQFGLAQKNMFIGFEGTFVQALETISNIS